MLIANSPTGRAEDPFPGLWKCPEHQLESLLAYSPVLKIRINVYSTYLIAPLSHIEDDDSADDLTVQ